jgi:hypothetical protein
MACHHSGFSVHPGNPIARDDRNGQKALAEYVLRNAFSEKKACPELVEGVGLFRPGDEPSSSGMSPEVTVLDVSDHRPRRVPSKTWRELIKKACASAGGYLGGGPSQLSPMRP